MSGCVLRLMGESDVHYVRIQDGDKRASVDRFETTEDKVNWLGHMMDTDKFAAISEADLKTLEAVTAELYEEIQSELPGNFVMMVVLREKWPVGSKAKFKVKADRVGAAHTYRLVICPSQQLDDLMDSKALEEAEMRALGAQLPAFKKAKKLFANSSALHGFLKQAGA